MCVIRDGAQCFAFWLSLELHKNESTDLRLYEITKELAISLVGVYVCVCVCVCVCVHSTQTSHEGDERAGPGPGHPSPSLSAWQRERDRNGQITFSTRDPVLGGGEITTVRAIMD